MSVMGAVGVVDEAIDARGVMEMLRLRLGCGLREELV